MKIRDVSKIQDGRFVKNSTDRDDVHVNDDGVRFKAKKTRSTFNPFFVQKYFAQYVCNRDIEPVRPRKLIYNLIYDLIILVAYGLNILMMEDKKGEGYNFISRLRFWVTVYIFPVFVVAVSGTFMIFRKDILRYYHAIDAVLDDFDKMGVKFKLKFTEMYVMYVLLFVSVIVVFVWDMIRSGSKYTVFFWFVNYVPPLCAMAYVITILYYSICCDQIFKAINQFLSLYCSDDLSSLEKLALCKKNVKPEKLLDLVEGEPYTYYEKIFILHDEACDIIRRINNISGYEFLSFIGCAAVTLLSLVYDTCLDMVMISRGVPTMKRSFYATSYWPTVYACTLVNIVRLSSRVMGNANSTKYYLHKLRNIYPQLHDHVEVFSLQLVHQNMELSAARFFILDRTVIYKLIGAFTTYIIILIQLETDSTEE